MAEPLVLIPGLMCDARLFAYQAAAASRQRTVIHAPVRSDDRIESMADRVLLDAPERFALAGFSLGGIVALDIVDREPGRVSRLALIDTDPHAETPQGAAAREPQIASARAGRLSDVVDTMIAAATVGAGPHRGDALGTIRAMAADLGPEVFVAQARALQRRPDRQDVLRDLRLPVTVICGRQDTLCPLRRHEVMASLIPGATLDVIEDAGHYTPLEQPQAVWAALNRWLSDILLLK